LRPLRARLSIASWRGQKSDVVFYAQQAAEKENIPGPVVAGLRERGHDVAAVKEFQTALRWGLAGLAISVGLGILAAWRRQGRPAPVAGLTIAAAAAIGLHATHGLPSDLRLGLLLLAAAGVVADLVGRPALIGGLLAVRGALVIGRVVPATPAWPETLVVVTIVAGGACVVSFDCRRSRRGVGPLLFALSVVGLYFTAPDTEHALVLLGAALPRSPSSAGGRTLRPLRARLSITSWRGQKSDEHANKCSGRIGDPRPASWRGAHATR